MKISLSNVKENKKKRKPNNIKSELKYMKHLEN